MNDLKNAKALIEQGALEVLNPPSETNPPRVFIKINEQQVKNSWPEQICVVMVEKAPGVQARFSLCIGRDKRGCPRLQVTAVKTADSSKAAEQDRVVNVSGKYVNWEETP